MTFLLLMARPGLELEDTLLALVAVFADCGGGGSRIAVAPPPIAAAAGVALFATMVNPV